MGTFKDSERLFLAMEYINGGELYSYMQNSGGALTPSECAFVVASVSAMIDHVHSRRFIYRDLKPENLMITGNGYLKLIDFGFCKELQKGERTFTCVGTLEYMAPEVLNLALGHGFEADWWSLGVLMYECFHGCSPYIKDDPDADDRTIIMRIRDTGFNVVMDDVAPTDAQACILGLLSHEPELRYDGTRIRGSAHFETFDWLSLLSRKMPSPLNVSTAPDPFDHEAFDPEEFDDGRSGEELLGLDAAPYVPTPDAWDALF